MLQNILFKLQSFVSSPAVNIAKITSNLKVIKGTISDKKNLQIALEIKTKYLAITAFIIFLKKSHNFDRKTIFFYRISFRGHWALFLSIGKFPLNFGIKFLVYLSILEYRITYSAFKFE